MQIELRKPHTHAGVLYPVRSVIAIDTDQAQWLIEIGVGRTVVSPAATNSSNTAVTTPEEKSK